MTCVTTYFVYCFYFPQNYTESLGFKTSFLDNTGVNLRQNWWQRFCNLLLTAPLEKCHPKGFTYTQVQIYTSLENSIKLKGAIIQLRNCLEFFRNQLICIKRLLFAKERYRLYLCYVIQISILKLQKRKRIETHRERLYESRQVFFFFF